MTATVKPLSKKAEAEATKQAAITALREMLSPGTTVYTILRHVSRSGMMRHISVIGPESNDITWQVARALGDRIDPKTGGIKVGGCGMDMGFHLVYNLSHRLYPDGFGVRGDGPNGHEYPVGRRTREQTTKAREGGVIFFGRNGDTSGWDNDGGYALRQRWL